MHVEIPIAYCERTKFAEQHAALFLKKFGHLVTWKSAEKEVIADIGSANGIITTDILLPFCQSKVHEIIGIDISSEMVQLAKELNKKPNVSFLNMDAAKRDIDDNLVEKFHHVFSFYCLHMIADQRQFADNVYKMLKPGGEAFITCVVRNNIMQGWFDICKHEKWRDYLKDFPKKFSNYQLSDRPQDEFEMVFRAAGFVVESYVEPITHVYADRDEFDRFLIEVNYVIDMVPESLKADFIKDFLEIMHNRSGNQYEMAMEVLVGIVRKPLN